MFDILNKAALALECLQASETMHVLDDNVLVSIPKDLWDDFRSRN